MDGRCFEPPGVSEAASIAGALEGAGVDMGVGPVLLRT